MTNYATLNRELNTNYTEIIKLHEMLESANIPHTFERLFDGYQIRLNENIDAIQHFGSYGHSYNTIEIMGGLTKRERNRDSVLGHLTAKEVFKRFKYCYKNNVTEYKVE